MEFGVAPVQLAHSLDDVCEYLGQLLHSEGTARKNVSMELGKEFTVSYIVSRSKVRSDSQFNVGTFREFTGRNLNLFKLQSPAPPLSDSGNLVLSFQSA